MKNVLISLMVLATLLCSIKPAGSFILRQMDKEAVGEEQHQTLGINQPIYTKEGRVYCNYNHCIRINS